MEITGRLIEIEQPKSGVSKANKEWIKQDIILETDDKFPKKICCTLFGEKVKLVNSFELNDILKVSVNVESNKFKDSWFTSLNVWKVEVQGKTESNNLLVPEKSEFANQDEGNLPF